MLPETERYAKGLAKFLGVSTRKVEDSLPVSKWETFYQEFRLDPVKFYKRGLERRKRLIEKYRNLIAKHRVLLQFSKSVKEINEHFRLIKEYERRIAKLEKSIERLEKLIRSKSES